MTNDGPIPLDDLLYRLTPAGEPPLDFTALAGWVNSGGCPAVVAEASRRLNAMLQGSADGILVSPDPRLKDGWGTLSPGQSTELLGISADGHFIMETGQPRKVNQARLRLGIATIASVWLANPEHLRGKFPLTPIVDAWYSSNSRHRCPRDISWSRPSWRGTASCLWPALRPFWPSLPRRLR